MRATSGQQMPAMDEVDALVDFVLQGIRLLTPPGLSLVEQRVDELLRVERRQVVGALTDARPA